MVGEAEVVVRPQHDALLTLDDDRGVLGVGNRLEIWIQASGLNLFCFGELAALVEELDALKRLDIHGGRIPRCRGRDTAD